LGVTENAIVEWFFDGRLALRGTLEPLALEGPVSLDTRDFVVSHGPWHERPVRRVIGVTSARLTSRWSIRPDGVRFENIAGELPHSRLRGDVLLGFRNELRVSARADVADLRDITPLDRFAIAGIGEASVSIDGTFQDPHVTGRLRFSDFVFDDFALGDVQSDAVLDPDGLGVRFAMVSAVKNGSRYRVEDLYLDFHDDRFALDGLLHADGLALADFYAILGFQEDERFTPYQGLARGQANLRYTNGFPGDSPSGTLLVDLDLRFDWANLNDYGFTDGRLVGRFRWLDWSRGAAGAELAIGELSLRKGRGTVTLDGRMSLGGHLRMDVVADGIALSDIEGVGDRFPELEGVASAVGRVGGTFDVMRADFDVGVTNVTYGGRALGDGRFFVRHTDREDPWVLEARAWDRGALPSLPCAHGRTGLAFADWPPDPPIRTVEGPRERLSRPMAFVVCGSGLDDRLTMDLAIGRTEALPLRGIVRLDGIDLSPLLPTTSDGRRIDGTMSGLLSFERGAIRAPETLEGSIVLHEVRLRQDELEVQNLRPVELVFGGGELAIRKARFVGPGSRLRVRGRASLQDGLALQVNGDVDLGLLARLSQTITEASGSIGARLSITGPFADPELYGQATVTDGRFRFASFDVPVERLSGRIEFSQRSVLFEDFTAEVAGGTLTASGQAELREQEIERYRFDVEAHGVQYALGEGIDAGFGADVRLAWSRGERLPTLSGRIVVDRLSYTRGIELRGILGEAASRISTSVLGSRRTRTEVRQYDPERDVVQLDVHVTQRTPFRIRNNLVDAEVRIQTAEQPFRIVGTDQRYGLVGALEIVRGDLFFQNNEFDVRRGIIRFDDPTRIDPHVDVEAITEIRRASDLSAPSWRIILTLTGPSESLRLQTRSEPGLPEQDILLLLAFGMTSGELQQLQGGGDLAGAAALEALTAVTGLDREVRRALPLIDDFRVTTGYSPRTGRTEPRLSVGRRIADQVRLSATTGLSESREVRASMEVQLDESQRVGVSYDNYNNTGANSLGNLGIDWGVRLE
ncbi:MAG TPA: translocation/assembly module TamB domain-containing protein, partial [Sandaracinaceae bacterium]